jgi:zinc protease
LERLLRKYHLGAKASLWAAVWLLAVGLIPSSGMSSPPSLPLTHYQLKNGLQVLLSEDFTLPLVSVAVIYRVGSLHDPPGKSGLAYLLENLMFLGSANVSQMQHMSYISRTGGSLNAATLEDRTLFYQTVPSNQLALVLWLESDRMRSLEITPAKVDAAKDELAAEIQNRQLGAPYLETFFNFDRMLFPDPAYSHPIIGRQEELRAMTPEDARNFYRQYYVPNNALLCIAGNFNPLSLRDLVSRYFDSIPRGPEPPPAPPLPALAKEAQTETIKAARIPVPGFHMAFRIINPRPGDLVGLTLIDYLLCRGKTSRLVERLVKRDRLAIQLTGGLERRGGLAAYRIFVTNNTELIAQQCRDVIFSELGTLKTSFVSEKELSKAKNIFKKDILDRLGTSLDRALYMGEQFLSRPVPDGDLLDLDRYLAITPQTVTGLVNRYFTRDNCIVLNIQR